MTHSLVALSSHSKMHPAKKRRLDATQASLNKPFRSPLRTSSKLQAPKEQTQTPDPGLQSQSCLPPPTIDSASPLKPQSLLRDASARPDTRDLQKEYTASSIRLTQLRQSLEIAQQALQIESSNQVAELRALIKKWKTIAQEAADELFIDAKDRVDGMGGIEAWRRRAEEDVRSWHDDLDEKDSRGHGHRSSGNSQRHGPADEGDGRECASSETDQEPESVSRGKFPPCCAP